mmetsp:Transcript_1578/g.2237  ORF Transcript_1578/g.2237 Transcript_1578/m.2237 type:complete len:757 (-) Transcript_1578:348-2618(-)
MTKSLVLSLTKAGCSALPNAEGGGGGGLAGPFFSLFWDTDEACARAHDVTESLTSYPLDVAKAVSLRDYESAGYEDCNVLQNGFNRVLCDLHCVKDAVKVGTDTVIRNIVGSNDNILKNLDMLMDYYSQLVMNKIEVEVAGIKPPTSKLLQQDPKRVSLTLASTIARYLTPTEIMDKPIDRINIQAVQILHEARLQTHTILNETLTKLHDVRNRVGNVHGTTNRTGIVDGSSQDFGAKAQSIMADTALRVERVLGRAHNEAIEMQSKGMKHKVASGSRFIQMRAKEQVNRLNLTFNRIRNGIYIRDSHVDTLERRGIQLIKTARELVMSGLVSQKGALNLKLDMIENDVLLNRASREASDFHSTMRRLTHHWSGITNHVTSYLDVARSLVSSSQGILDEIASYLDCQSGGSFIADASYRFNTHIDENRKTIRAILPSVSTLLHDHIQILEFENIIVRSIDMATRMVVLPSTHPAAFWSSPQGISHARQLIEDKVEIVTLALARQSLSMIAQARFLEVRSAQDGGRAIPEAVKLQLRRNYQDMFAALSSQLSSLMTPEDSARLVMRMIDKQLPLASRAPAPCKELAFEKHGDALASTLTTLARRKQPSSTNSEDVKDVYILAQPSASMFFTLSRDLLNNDTVGHGANVTANVPTAIRFPIYKSPKGMLDLLGNDKMVELGASMYVCTSRSDGRWEVIRAVDLEEAQAVVLCVGGEISGCESGDIHIPSGSRALESADLSGKKNNSTMMSFWVNSLEG